MTFGSHICYYNITALLLENLKYGQLNPGMLGLVYQKQLIKKVKYGLSQFGFVFFLTPKFSSIRHG